MAIFPGAGRGFSGSLNRACALGPDYGQVGAEHFLIGDASTLRAKAQRMQVLDGPGDGRLTCLFLRRRHDESVRHKSENSPLRRRGERCNFARSFTNARFSLDGLVYLRLEQNRASALAGSIEKEFMRAFYVAPI